MCAFQFDCGVFCREINERLRLGIPHCIRIKIYFKIGNWQQPKNRFGGSSQLSDEHKRVIHPMKNRRIHQASQFQPTAFSMCY